MARKKTPDSRPEPGFRSVPVAGARRLVTIGPEDACWQKNGTSADCAGAIVRVQAPEGATDEEVARVVENLRATGAVAVRVDSRRRPKVVLEPREKRPHARARDVVLELARAANVDDVPGLISFVEQVLGRCSL